MNTSAPASVNPAFERLLEKLKTPSRRPSATPLGSGTGWGEADPAKVARERERRRAIERLYERIAGQSPNTGQS